jgi:hypothetical protein
MITPDSFKMIESVSRAALEKHPVWAHFESPQDRQIILDWGVASETVDGEIKRYEYCGPPPLYPVLELDPLPSLPHLVVGVTFESSLETRCSGYLLEPHAYGVFVGDEEFCLNRNLPQPAKEVAERLADALGTSAELLFPLHYASKIRNQQGIAIQGAIEAFW